MKKLLLLLCLVGGLCAFAQRRPEELWAVWNNASNHDTVRMQAVYEVCRDYYVYSNPDTVILLTNMLHEMARQRHMDHFNGKLYNCQLQAYISMEDYPRAMEYGRKALSVFQKIKFYKGVSAVAENMAVIHMRQGDYYQSFRLFTKGLQLKELLGDSAAMPAPLINMGVIYMQMGKLDSAWSCHRRALRLAERHGPTSSLIRVLQNMGNLSQRRKKMDTAFAYFERARLLAEPLGNDSRLAAVYDQLVSYYREKKEPQKALEYEAKSMAIYKSMNSRLSMAKSMHMRSTVYFSMEQLEKARVIAEEAIKMLGSDAEPALRRDMYSDLGNVYYNKKDYKKALQLHLRFIALRDSLRNDSLANILMAEQTRAAMERQELLLKSEADKRLLEAHTEAEYRDQQKNFWIIVSASLLVILGLSGYFAYSYLRQKNIIADQKNRLLSEKLLVSQMNPHFIFNSLNAIQNFIFKQDNYLAGIYLKQFSELIRMILEFSRREYITLEEERKFLVSYLELQKLRFNGKMDYSIHIDERLDRESVLVPPMLGQPFAENAIEHGIFHLEGHGTLSVRIHPEEDALVYEIEDNGVGLAAADAWKKSRHRSLATDITRERLTTLHRENSGKSDLKIIDKNSLPGMGSGVLVKFTIP